MATCEKFLLFVPMTKKIHATATSDPRHQMVQQGTQHPAKQGINFAQILFVHFSVGSTETSNMSDHLPVLISTLRVGDVWAWHTNALLALCETKGSRQNFPNF